MGQLEGLMRMLKNQQTTSPRSTPNSSPRSGKSPPLPSGSSGNSNARNSLPSTLHNQFVNILGTHQSSEQLLNDVRTSFGGPNNGNIQNNRMRNDLHYAADTVTSAMSTLVRGLNTGNFFIHKILLCYKSS